MGACNRCVVLFRFCFGSAVGWASFRRIGIAAALWSHSFYFVHNNFINWLGDISPTSLAFSAKMVCKSLLDTRSLAPMLANKFCIPSSLTLLDVLLDEATAALTRSFLKRVGISCV